MQRRLSYLVSNITLLCWALQSSSRQLLFLRWEEEIPQELPARLDMELWEEGMVVETVPEDFLNGQPLDDKARLIQTILFVAGLNTLLQSFFGTRLPAVIGASYTFVAPTISIILAGRYSNSLVDPEKRFKQTVRGTQGALIVASTLQIILGFSGLWRNVVRFLSPLSAVPLVSLVGFGLYEFGFPGYVPHVIRLDRHVFDRFAVILSVAIVWVYAHLLTVGGAYKGRPPKTQDHCRTDRAGLVGAAPWIRIPYPFQWGTPTFDAGDAFAMMAASFVALVESTGTFIAVSRYASATMVPPSILSRGIGWQTFLNMSLVNANSGKFGAVFASIPAPIVAALYCLFFAYVGSAGLSFLQFCNLNSFRTKFILGFSIFMGLSVPQYFNEFRTVAGYGPVHTNARWFNDIINVPFSSEAFVAGLIAYFLDNTLHRGDRSIRKDRGRHFWDKFRSFKTDPRSDEFYSLPFKLNRFFPSV
ncbi:Nucleobase-ascorbate transporter 6 [Asimina triloba]